MDECLAVHDMMLAHYGGKRGVRDFALLESALGRPPQWLHYGKPDLPDLASAYAAGIVKNHPFIDGKKRTGFMIAAGFLERNGCEFVASEADAVLHTLALAAGQITDDEYAAWLRKNSRAP
jgi:death on curing protein